MCGGQSNEKLLCFLSCGGFTHLHREKKAKNAPGFTTMEMDHQGSLLPLCVLQMFRAGLWMCKWALESQSLLITNQNIASHHLTDQNSIKVALCTLEIQLGAMEFGRARSSD